ncbi:hypothetical protein GO755_25635 [Spirosoma sp. HMF4905]|uniref:Fibronectin type-III domain-containing protein n=1 Tax=Spirosoma arboris TaxID=2682092 RepID=A0A7K1SIA4_9BACT|nr:M43 family zinc metalloprotease [Spirosoma arboris]MVM33444.1 hypothetical protein [Spirosoma arboris]
MTTLTIRWGFFLGFGLWLTGFIAAFAQPTLPQKLPVCTIPELTTQQKQSLQKQLDFVLQLKKSSRLPTASSITYVPIRPHIFRTSNGSGGFDLTALNFAMARTNHYFLLNGTGIQFYFCGDTPDYVDNDDAYTDFDQNRDRNLLVDVRNALNQYYFNFSTTISGFGYYPYDDLISTRSYISTNHYNVEGQLIGIANYTMPHELGHNFFLYHTFSPNRSTDELVTRGAGANCSTAGDLICDTPADPYNLPGATIETNNFCVTYTGTITDANGDLYTPLVDNFMSYYPYYARCRDDKFTPGQVERMQEALYMRQHYMNCTLDCPPTNVASPTNLSVTPTATSVVLTWQDNASNEMGYFIERSSPQTDLVAISGVGPNVTTFTDTSARAGIAYSYRIRPSNTTTGSLSPIVSLESGFYTINSGAWNDPGIWSFGQVPTETDDVHIRHAVTVPQNYKAKAQRIIYESPVKVTLDNEGELLLSQ